MDARWTKKHGKSYFGYKSHISIDVEYGFIRRYAVTDAAVHDSQTLGQLLDDENDTDGVWADSAYRSETIEAVLALLQFERATFTNALTAIIPSPNSSKRTIVSDPALVPKSNTYLAIGS